MWLIIFSDEYLTINATKAINAGCEIFNTFGNMSNTRLLHMYGFAEESNPYDDAHLSYEIIIKSIREHPIEAVDAKIKLMDSLGFFNESKQLFFLSYVFNNHLQSESIRKMNWMISFEPC